MKSKKSVVLIPIDFSDLSVTSLLFAKNLSSAYTLEIHFLHIMEALEVAGSASDRKEFQNEILPVMHDRIESFIQIHWPEIENAYQIHISSGKINKQINNIATQIDANLVVMGTHGTSTNDSIDKFVLGSNAYRTVYSSKCPVITVRQNWEIQPLKTILLPLDLTKYTAQKINLAKSIALRLNAKIRILTVNTKLSNNRAIRSALTRKMLEAKESIKEAGIEVEYTIVHSRDIAKTVIKTAMQENVDMVVIMTRQETLLSEWTIGGQARKVIEDCPIPVLSIHPMEEWVTA